MGSKSLSDHTEFVLNYLNKVGIKASRSERQYWNNLSSKYGKKAINQLSKAMAERFEAKDREPESESFYELKNQNLELSLDVANFSADLYRRYFEWFATNRSEKTPRRILDLGCDNGIAACFLGALYPESVVVGIDVQRSTLERANELAQKLNLSNVSFIEVDLKDMDKHFSNQSFDLITSLRSFHEIIDGFSDVPRHWSTEELLNMDTHFDHEGYLNIVQSLLHDENSEFISCERLPWLGAITKWTKELDHAGFHINWEDSDHIQFHEVGNEQQMPIIIASKYSSNDRLLEQLYNFATKESTIHIAPNNTYKDSLAEAIFHQIDNKKFVSGAQVNFMNGSGKMRIELWTTGDLAALYQFSDVGYRHLKLEAIDHLDQVKEEIGSILSNFKGQEQFEYETLEMLKQKS